MDGTWIAIITNSFVTVSTIGGAAWVIRGTISDAKDAAKDAKGAADSVNTQITDFRRFCDERHAKLDKEIDRLRNQKDKLPPTKG